MTSFSHERNQIHAPPLQSVDRGCVCGALTHQGLCLACNLVLCSFQQEWGDLGTCDRPTTTEHKSYMQQCEMGIQQASVRQDSGGRDDVRVGDEWRQGQVYHSLLNCRSVSLEQGTNGLPVQQAASSTCPNGSSPLVGGPQIEGSWSQNLHAALNGEAVPVDRAYRGSS